MRAATWNEKQLIGREETLLRVGEGEEGVLGEVCTGEVSCKHSVSGVKVGGAEKREVLGREEYPPAEQRKENNDQMESVSDIAIVNHKT